MFDDPVRQSGWKATELPQMRYERLCGAVRCHIVYVCADDLWVGLLRLENWQRLMCRKCCFPSRAERERVSRR